MKPLWFAISLALAASPALALSDAPVTLTVDARQTGPVINRNIFGQFTEHLGRGVYEGIWVGEDSKISNTRGIRNDVVEALKGLHIPNVRWPGGCYADEYHWKKGIGKDRQPTLNASWGGTMESNAFGTHEFMDFLEQIGSEAYISVNVGSGSPQEAAEWLEYMTTDKPTELGQLRAQNGHPAPYKVAMLGLGNESWGCGGSMKPENYVPEMRRFANYSKNYNPAQQKTDKMYKIAVGPDRDDYGWTEAVMQAWTQRVWSWDIDALSMHRYTWVEGSGERATGFTAAQYASLLQDTLKTEDMLLKHFEIMDKYDPEKKVGLVFDEWGTWFAVEEGENRNTLYQQNSQRDALVAALNLNLFIKHADRVRGANIAQMINVLQSMILTRVEQMILTPTYHVFRMYVPFQDATSVPVSFDAGTYSEGDITLPRIDAIGAIGKDGKLWLAVTNLDPRQAVSIQATVPGFSFRNAAGQTLAGTDMGSFNSFDVPDRVVPQPVALSAKGSSGTLSLPPHSVTVVGLERLP